MNDIDDVYICDLGLEPPKYKDNCDMIDICKDVGCVNKFCYKDCYITDNGRCSIDKKRNILQQYNAQKAALKNKKEFSKKQFRHDWKIEIFSTLGGAIAGFLTSLIFWLLAK